MRDFESINFALFRLDPTLDPIFQYTRCTTLAFGDSLLDTLLYVLENHGTDLSFNDLAILRQKESKIVTRKRLPERI